MSGGNEGMRKLIETINRIQDASSRIGGDGLKLDLPQIAVVGGQSAGKSSVLENFVGRDFLPRGSGIVTRCPLILQLIHTPNEEYGVFLHSPEQKYSNFNEIREEIIRETDRKIGNNKNVSSDPINLRIYSPHVLDLTLIDLPGITRNPVGDQPKDIEHQIIKVVLDYISNENCLILAVSAANQDLATSDAIKIASQVDPDGERTIGVLTKLDLMDDGTDARDILDNKVVPLKRGYIGVVNRSQSDITKNKNIDAALEAEEHFFETHPAYHHIANRLGTRFLQKTLNEQLTKHITNAIPALVNKLQTTVRDLEDRKEKFQINVLDEDTKTKRILDALKEMKNDFEAKIGVVLKSSKVILPKDKLTGGALIKRIMNEKYRSAIDIMSFNDEEMRREISFAIINLRGVHIGLFTPDMAFDTVVMNQIARFEDPSNMCVDLVSTELLRIIRECCTKLKMYPKLRESLEYILTEHVEKRQRKVKNKIKERIEMENAYMNTDHEDFLGLKGAMRLMEDNNVPKNESVETPKTRSLTKTKSQSTFHLNSNIVQEGWITIRNSKMFWFVLTDFNLSWYKKEDKKSRIAGYDVNPSTVMQYDLTGTQITLTFSNKKSDEMELLFQSRDDFNRWYDAFSIVGIVVDDPERKSLLTFEEQNGKPNVLLTHQTELIRVLVDSYIKIIKKNLKDIIPKLLMHGVINNTREFLTSELHVSILAQDKDELLQFDPEAERLHKELTEKFDSCKEALTMIRKIATDSF